MQIVTNGQYAFTVPAEDSVTIYLEDHLPCAQLLHPKVTFFNTSESTVSVSATWQMNFGITGNDLAEGNHEEEILAELDVDAGASLPLPVGDRVAGLSAYVALGQPIRHKVVITNPGGSDLIVRIVYSGVRDIPGSPAVPNPFRL